MKIGFYGGAGTVTGSRFLLEGERTRLLVDCGLFQGLKALRLLNWQAPAFDARSIDAVVLTHAHLDHCGYLPRLLKLGFTGRIYCSEATAELAEILLRDAASIQEEDADFANRHGFSKHHPALPLFDTADVEATLPLLTPIKLKSRVGIGEFDVTLHDSGHILGSTFAEIGAQLPDGKRSTIVFSGDVGPYDTPLTRDPEPLPACDTVVLESTYGDRIHSTVTLEEQLLEPLLTTIRQKGTVLIPAFAVARAQLVMVLLRRLMLEGRLPTVPIHVDSPMAIQVTRVYQNHVRELDASREDIFPKGVQLHRTVQQSKVLNHLPGPRIIIASSGMLTGGRVLHHLERLMADHRNLLVLVGYQAAGTRGRSLLAGAQTLRMHGRDLPVKIRFTNIEGLSAHGDSNDLMRWLKTAPNKPANVFLVHGEANALEALRGRLENEGASAVVPAMNERFVLSTPGAWLRDETTQLVGG